MGQDPGLELEIANVPTVVNKWTVIRHVAQVVHSDEFGSFVEGRLLNFKVELGKSKDETSIRNNGTGTLIFPFEKSGFRFLDFVKRDPIKIDGRKLKFFFSNRTPSKKIIQILSKTNFLNPDLEEQHQNTLRALEGEFRVDVVQFGIFFRESYPSKTRSFSIEWERNYVRSYASLSFEYDHRAIILKLGSPLTEQDGYNVRVSFSSIQRIGIGLDGRPYICFETLLPAILEKLEFHRSSTGDKQENNYKYKHRVGFVDEAHCVISSYAPHLRVELHDTPGVIDKFVQMCNDAAIGSAIVRFPPTSPLLAVKNNFFAGKRLYKLRLQYKNFPWPVIFQLEAFLLNGVLHTGDLEKVVPLVSSLLSKVGPDHVADFLRYYHEALKIRKPAESPISCFQTKLRNFTYSKPQSTADIRCSHITFTPTRLHLEGPYATQSNRVLRRYQGYEDHFIRVDFRDEDMLQYRWDREVDGTFFIANSVGTKLKQGFEFAGRHFEFLAYSNSALRDHSVWFMNPFQHPNMGWIEAESIRKSLGDFRGELLKQPSKYAARLGQAFTATDASVKVRRHEWIEVEDLVCPIEPHLFTDGVGTISRDLQRRIWGKHCVDKRITTPTVEPSAFLIRFLGYKGVVSVDDELDKGNDGIHMRLRGSMRKFDVDNDDEAPIEIAQVFNHPKFAYLNRTLVMALEDLGVRKEAILTLQHNAVAMARTIDQSIEKFESIVSEHKMGNAFDLPKILGYLRSPPYNAELTLIDNPFFRKLRRVATTSILRDIKHGARIPISRSYLLVGVADEGPAEEMRGRKNVFCLNEAEIFACIQKTPDAEPEWLEGNATISRSPVTHVGDVQRVRLVGKPPNGVFCAFRHLRNLVVLPSRGDRSLASCLGGGDVDGDVFSVIFEETLLTTSIEDPATYASAGTKTLDWDCMIEDVADFVAEYIISDVLGLLSDRLLTIADQSNEGMRDEICQELAVLCSQAVDYPKQGKPVELEEVPRTLIRVNPDWHAAEVVSPRKVDYYESSRALGHMFRAIQLEDPDCVPETQHCTEPTLDPITLLLFQRIECYLEASANMQELQTLPSEVFKIFERYQEELQYICATHTLTNNPETRLLEEEIVIGTILAKCSQKRWRSNRIYRMGFHAQNLISDVKRTLADLAGFNGKVASPMSCVRLLDLCWKSWQLSVYKREELGANSFGLIVLGLIFDCLDRLKQ